MTKPIDVMGIGCVVLDSVGVVNDFPAPDEKTRVFELQQTCGGPAASAMVACHRLGLEPILIAKTGDDEPGRRVREMLAAEGLDTSHLIEGYDQDSMQGFCFAEKGTGRRIIYYYRSRLALMKPAQIDVSLLKRTRVLLVDGLELPVAAYAAEIVRGAGGVTVMDAGSVRPGVEHVLPHIDYLVASWMFARDLTGKETPEAALEALRWSGYHRAVVITLGEEGYLAGRGGLPAFRGEAFKVRAVDTTGAGDAFHGGFCVGMAKGWPLEQTCEFAAAVAAMKCRMAGGQAGLPRWDEVIDFLNERSPRLDWEMAAT